MSDMREILTVTYLDYLNNYLTVARYAEDNGLTQAQADTLLRLARNVVESTHPEA